MTCGMTAEVIADRGSKDIDVRFSDGTVVEHRCRNAFLKGSIGNPTLGTRFSSKRSIIGCTKKMNCGLIATVIADRNAQDIDVRFENGDMVFHKCRGDFRKGTISSPSLGKTYATHEARRLNTSILNQTQKMNCGMSATVINDNGSADITVRFEDGTIVEHRTRNSFKKCEIKNPNYDPSSIVGQSQKMRNGLNATCISYRNSCDINVQFEDGVIVEHKNKSNFLNGRIAHPSIDAYNQLRRRIIGETKMMNCGMKCTVIKDRSANDIDVKFEDGIVVEHKTRQSFKSGAIANPLLLTNSLPEQLIYHFIKKHFSDARRSYRPRWLKNPESNTNLEIDIWIPSKKIGIEYDGAAWHKEENQRSKTKAELISNSNNISYLITVLERDAIIHNSSKHINYQLQHQSLPSEYIHLISELESTIKDILAFLGINEEITIDDELINAIRESGRYSQKDIEVLENVKNDPQKLVGETRIMNCTMKATIIAARSFRDIDIQFEDGTIVEHRDKYSFYSGAIANPTLGANYKRTVAANILGATRKMNCGMYATVIAYNKSDNIDVQFEDGEIVKGHTKYQFLNGGISHPKLGTGYSRRKKQHIGEAKVMKNGQLATIIEYNTFSDITVEFEDKTKISHISMDSFNTGYIRNPNIESPRKTNITGATNMMNCGMEATVIAYQNANNIDVQFSDGTIVKHKSKDSFLKGAIWNPNCKKHKE